MRFYSLPKSNKRPAEGFYLLRECVRFHSKECAGKYGDFISCDDIICHHLGPVVFLQSVSSSPSVGGHWCPSPLTDVQRNIQGGHQGGIPTLWPHWLVVTDEEEQRLLVVWFLIISITTCCSWLSVSVTACLGEFHLWLMSFHVCLDREESLHSLSWSQKSKILFPWLHTQLQPSRREVKCYNEVFLSAKMNEKGVKVYERLF